MKGIVDRIEGDFLVVELENLEMVDISIDQAPDAKEGDVIIIKEGSITIDREETRKREERIRKLFNDLLE